jgi:hypothetical protein
MVEFTESFLGSWSLPGCLQMNFEHADQPVVAK